MDRRSLVASLFAFLGIARAQSGCNPGHQGTPGPTGLRCPGAEGVPGPRGYSDCLTGTNGQPAWKTGKVRNNQCPVCGVMAEPRKYVKAYGPAMPYGDGRTAIITYRFIDPGEMAVRCRRCNAAFWQDAE